MVRIPDLDDAVHERVDLLTTRNGLSIREGYETIIRSVVDEDGRIENTGVEALKEELPAEKTSAFD